MHFALAHILVDARVMESHGIEYEPCNDHIVKTRLPKDKLFVQDCSIEEFLQKYQITAIFDQSHDQNRKKP